MYELDDLEIDLDIKGWDFSGGRSDNVWGLVPSSYIPLELIKKYVQKHNKKSCIWTCYDKSFYEERGGRYYVNELAIPDKISATFKPSFNKYCAIVENMAMRIAIVLDMPTSYNYLVKFDKKKWPKITEHFRTSGKNETVMPYGVVSIDFLQAVQLDRPQVVDDVITRINGKISYTMGGKNFSGDELISFSENVAGAKVISTEPEYIKNWIDSVQLRAKEVNSLPKEDLKTQLEHVNSRIVRSFLLRELLGDCDFTDLNSGIVVNEEMGTLNYAPNFDYGECFNVLINIKLDYLPQESELEKIMESDKDYIAKKVRIANETKIEDLAKKFASPTSHKNLFFVLMNYLEDATEFFNNLQYALENNKIENIIRSYNEMSVEGRPLLTKDECELFIKYIKNRADWLIQFYKKRISILNKSKEINEKSR